MSSFQTKLLGSVVLIGIALKIAFFLLQSPEKVPPVTLKQKPIPYGFSTNDQKDRFFFVSRIEEVEFDQKQNLLTLVLNYTPEKRFFPHKRELSINPDILFVSVQETDISPTGETFWSVYKLEDLKRFIFPAKSIAIFESAFSLGTITQLTQLYDGLPVSTDSLSLTIKYIRKQ